MNETGYKSLFSLIVGAAYALFMMLYTPTMKASDAVAQVKTNALPNGDPMSFMFTYGWVAVAIVLFVIWFPNIKNKFFNK